MNVMITVDTEIWCKSWHKLDAQFETAYEHYIYGRTPEGEDGLVGVLAHLREHRLKAVFFVEPLFSLRFGAQYLKEMVDMILTDGHEIQLHMHTEWVDEISPPVFSDVVNKRQHLYLFSLEEQTRLIGLAKETLMSAGASDIVAFRAGGFACNRDTYRALAANGIRYDSSLNACFDHTPPDVNWHYQTNSARNVDGVMSLPMTVFLDGMGRTRPLQLGACSAQEMRSTLRQMNDLNCPLAMILLHNFELLSQDKTHRDKVVTRRFDKILSFLRSNADFSVVGFHDLNDVKPFDSSYPRISPYATSVRLGEQLFRNWRYAKT